MIVKRQGRDYVSSKTWICLFANGCTQVSTYMYICIYMWMPTTSSMYVCMYVRMYVHVCTCLCESIRLQSAWVNMPWLSEVMQSLLKSRRSGQQRRWETEPCGDLYSLLRCQSVQRHQSSTAFWGICKSCWATSPSAETSTLSSWGIKIRLFLRTVCWRR